MNQDSQFPTCTRSANEKITLARLFFRSPPKVGLARNLKHVREATAEDARKARGKPVCCCSPNDRSAATSRAGSPQTMRIAFLRNFLSNRQIAPRMET